MAAVCYGICRTNPLPLQELQDYIPTGLVKKVRQLDANNPTNVHVEAVVEVDEAGVEFKIM